MKTNLSIIATIMMLVFSTNAYSLSAYSAVTVETEKGNSIEILVYQEKEIEDSSQELCRIHAEKQKEKEEKEKNNEKEDSDFDIKEILFEEEAVDFEIDTESIYKEILGYMSDTKASL